VAFRTRSNATLFYLHFNDLSVLYIKEVFKVKFVCLSDTHRYRDIEIPSGDVLLYAGDDDIVDTYNLINFTRFTKKVKFKHYIITSGNHDFLFEEQSFAREYLLENDIIYLQDEFVIIEGIKIYATPYTPTFFNWAFMESEENLEKRYNKIPDDTSILITHGPAFGYLDQVDESKNTAHLGSKALDKKISSLKNLKYHIFGHIHGGYGMIIPHYNNGYPVRVNCSICNEAYQPVNKPITLEVNKNV
jgi:hypothetical protein